MPRLDSSGIEKLAAFGCSAVRHEACAIKLFPCQAERANSALHSGQGSARQASKASKRTKRTLSKTKMIYMIQYRSSLDAAVATNYNCLQIVITPLICRLHHISFINTKSSMKTHSRIKQTYLFRKSKRVWQVSINRQAPNS